MHHRDQQEILIQMHQQLSYVQTCVCVCVCVCERERERERERESVGGNRDCQLILKMTRSFPKEIYCLLLGKWKDTTIPHF